MAVVGGNLETKEIGLPFGLSGTHRNTQVDTVTGFLKLVEIDKDGLGNPVYAEEGYWESDVIDFAEKFADYDKVFITSTSMGADSYAIQTRVSEDNLTWSAWTPIALDGTIQSETKRYIQVRIILYAGFVNDVFIINKSEFIPNDYIIEKERSQGGYIVPKLSSNTSSTEGFAFAQTELNSSNGAWKAFNKADATEKYLTLTGAIAGFLGFYFNSGAMVSKYKVRSAGASGYLPRMIKNWVLQASNDTTNGTDGTWVDLDTQTNQTWTTAYTDKEYIISNRKKYKAYRIKWSENNGELNWSSIGQLDFYEEGTTFLSLKREYEYDMSLDTTWTQEGSLHRQKITRDEWLKIDKMNVLIK